MATIGEVLLTPEDGWQRYDDSNSYIIYNGTWDSSNYTGYYNNTRHFASSDDSFIEFYFYGTKLRIITLSTPNRGLCNITIDDVSESYNASNTSTIYQVLLYEKLNLEKKIHHVKIEKASSYLDLDCIDIDDDGHMCTEDDYLTQEGLSEFPVKIADDTVESEADMATYANILTNGERQLLIVDKIQKMYVTDGQGGYTDMSVGGTGASINDENIAEDKVYSNQKTQELIDDVIDKTLDKETYASEINEGAVKYADNLSVTMNAQPLQYYGTNNENELGMHYFPINTKDNTGLEQRVCLNAKANQIITVDSALDISDNKVIVDCYKFVEGEEDVISTIKTFNNTEKDNFFYDEDNIEFTDSMHIKKEYELVLTKNNDGFYESEIIDMSKFLELSLSEVNN